MSRRIEAVIHDIHMAEEPFVLATAHDTEVHPIAVVLEHKSAAGREIARTRNHMRPHRCGSNPERHHCNGHHQSACDECGCQLSLRPSSLSVAHCFLLHLAAVRGANEYLRSRTR